MATITQYYDGATAPLDIGVPPDDPLRAWASQRARFRGVLAALPADAWDGPTRCGEWDVRALTAHLASGVQFLGWTLHQAGAGVATELLRDFDTQVTPGAAASLLADLDHDELLAKLAEFDENVEREARRLADDGWTAIAEAPPGHVPAHLAVSHFLWDSWVHEHDVLLPRGERPVLDPLEAGVVTRYGLGLAAGITRLHGTIGCHLTDLDLTVTVTGDGAAFQVRDGDAADGSMRLEGRAQDIVDRSTGREGSQVSGDVDALAMLDELAQVLAT